jgi:L-fuculose-phosphate aldolase
LDDELRRTHRAFRRAARRLWARGLIAGAEGNLSLRRDDGSIWITGRGVAKAWLGRDDVALVAADGAVLRGEPSTELALHGALYATTPARAVVHAHPPTAVGFTLAHPDARWLPDAAHPELLVATGGVPITPYRRPGTSALAEAAADAARAFRVVLLGQHGALAWGESLDEAVGAIEGVEQATVMLAAAAAFGGAVDLPADEVAWLRAAGRAGR